MMYNQTNKFQKLGILQVVPKDYMESNWETWEIISRFGMELCNSDTVVESLETCDRQHAVQKFNYLLDEKYMSVDFSNSDLFLKLELDTLGGADS